MMNTDDKLLFLPVKLYYEPEDASTPRSAPDGAAVQNASEAEQLFLPPRPYFVSNEMAALDERRESVLKLMARVKRSAARSAERLAAERELITAKSNLRAAARSRASELEAQIAAMKQQGANDADRLRLERELASVNDLLRAPETEELPSKATNSPPSNAAPQPKPRVLNSWRNALGELVEQTDTGLRVCTQPPPVPAASTGDVSAERAENWTAAERCGVENELHEGARAREVDLPTITKALRQTLQGALPTFVVDEMQRRFVESLNSQVGCNDYLTDQAS